MTIGLDRDLTLGNYLLLAHPDADVLSLPGDGITLERVDVRQNRTQGAVLETQAGRLFASPELLARLRRLATSDGELVMLDGIPHLFASAAVDHAATINVVARMQELGEHDEPSLAERRQGTTSEVTLLLRALSAGSTSDELELVLKVGVGFIRRRAAAHPALDPEIVRDLVRRGNRGDACRGRVEPEHLRGRRVHRAPRRVGRRSCGPGLERLGVARSRG